MILVPESAELPIGKALTAITYETLWSHEPIQCREDVDAVSISVRLEFGNSTFVSIRWLMKGFVESIALGERGTGEPTPDSREIDASSRWPRQIGSRLEGAAWSYQNSPGGDAPWACRLVLSGKHDLVIALGECDGGRISYIPDSLLVIGSLEVASSYQPPAAYHSAWGELR